MKERNERIEVSFSLTLFVFNPLFSFQFSYFFVNSLSFMFNFSFSFSFSLLIITFSSVFSQLKFFSLWHNFIAKQHNAFNRKFYFYFFRCDSIKTSLRLITHFFQFDIFPSNRNIFSPSTSNVSEFCCFSFPSLLSLSVSFSLSRPPFPLSLVTISDFCFVSFHPNPAHRRCFWLEETKASKS